MEGLDLQAGLYVYLVLLPRGCMSQTVPSILDFEKEAALLAVLLFYVAVWWFGSSRNKRAATKWYVQLTSIFARVCLMYS